MVAGEGWDDWDDAAAGEVVEDGVASSREDFEVGAIELAEMPRVEICMEKSSYNERECIKSYQDWYV